MLDRITRNDEGDGEDGTRVGRVMAAIRQR